MTSAHRPALHGTVLGRLLGLWNPIYKVLLRSPLHWPWSRYALVVEFTGRKTGRAYNTPAHYVRDGATLLLTSGDRWTENFSGGAPVTVWLGGKRRRGTAELITDIEQCVELHRRMIKKRPIFGRLIGVGASHDEEKLRRSLKAGRKAIVVRLNSA